MKIFRACLHSFFYHRLPLAIAAGLGLTIGMASAAVPRVWLKADALTGLSQGDLVGVWQDVSGYGYNATQTQAEQRPTYVTNAINGQPAVRFDADRSTCLNFSRPVQDDFSIVGVFQSTQGFGSGTLYYQGAGLVNGEVGGVTTDFGLCLFANGSICAGTGSPDVAINSGTGFNDGRPHVFVFKRTRSTGSLALYVDGLLAGTTTGSTASLTAPSVLTLGAQQTQIYYLSGDIAEVQIYAGALADADRQTIENALFQKYQLVPATPAGLYLQAQGGAFELHWQASSGAAGYYIKRALTPTGPFTSIATNMATTFTDPAGAGTNVYYYVVAAYNAAGPSTDSTAVGTAALLTRHDVPGPSSRMTPLVFSEIMYKPAARTDGKNLEFIEIYNSNPWFHDLSGYRVTCADMSYTFPAGTVLAANSYLVIAAAPTDIQSIYGVTNVLGPYTGSLKKAETLQLLDEQSAVLLTVPYTDVSPWPVAATGTGHSIILANPTYGEGDPRAWDISDTMGGSPGAPDEFHPNPLRRVVINEILPHAENGGQFVELYNHSAASVDVSGGILTDDAAVSKYVIPASTVIGPGGFLSVPQTQLGFTLNGAGGTLFFLQPDRSRVLDAVQFGAQADGVSFGRWPDGADDFYAFTSNTPGTNNSAIRVGDIVINELMYDPISGNDDDQYIELYNQGTNAINLAGWQLTAGVTFTFPQVTLAPGGYLVVARNQARLLGRYSNLNASNTVGDFSGKLSHNGELVTLSQPQTLNTNAAILVVEDQVAYSTGGRWGQWSHAGGSSLELVDPRANHRLAANWADSDETQKSAWTTIEATGTLDNGVNYESSIAHAQIGLLDTGECLVDNVEVNWGGTNFVANSTFESGLNGWACQGDMVRSSLENSGYASARSLHLRCSERLWPGDNSCQVNLNANPLTAGQTVTLRFKARWLHGWPEALLRLNGNWLEAAGSLAVPTNLGTPGAANSRAVAHAGPTIYNVTHFPALPAATQPAVISAQLHDAAGIQSLTLCYRLDPATVYANVPMRDDGTGGDSVAGDGVYSATIPGQAAGTLAAFYLLAMNSNAVVARFPAALDDNSPSREGLVMFGDGNPGGSFGVYHLWLSQTNVTRWATLGNMSNEGNDCTMVNGNRVIYNAQARFTGSPVHQYYDTPTGTLCSYKWMFNDDDKFLGATSFNKIHVPGNTDNDPTIQREQLANTFLRALGVPWLNRRYVAVYVNGNRRGPLMEDAQTPDGDVVKEHFPNDADGYLFKLARWFEFAPALSGYSLANTLASEAMLMPYTTTDGSKKLARYRWTFESRRTPDSASNYTNLFSLIDAASAQSSPNYVQNLENLADMENWMRVFAANHAAGNWDCFGSLSGQNLYAYAGTEGTKWSLLMFDFNIGLGIDGSFAPGQDLFTTLSGDSNVAGIFNTPEFRRMYWRALGELVARGPLNLSLSAPLMNAKYAAFTANGLSVEDPNLNLIPWLTQAGPVITSQRNAVNAASFTTETSMVVSNNLAYLTGQAPFDVATIQINGAEYPLTWITPTNWVVAVPLTSGTNRLSVVGVDRQGQPLTAASNYVSVVYAGTNASPVGRVVINEIMAVPAVPDAEFVELYNIATNQAMDLSGWQFQGLSYTFPNGSLLAPNSYLVLARNAAAFAAAYGATNPVFDTFDGSLARSENLALKTSSATNAITVARVKYEQQLPWPTNADGTGASLQLVNPGADNWRVGNWAATLARTNYVAAPQWVYVTATGTASSSTLYLYLQSAGDVYVDDLKLVAGSVPEAGANVLSNGDFESAFPGAWTVSANLTGSALSSTIKHAGNASLHLVSTSAGSSQGSSLWQTVSPALTANATYTLSFWYRQSTNGGPLTLRLSFSGISVSVNPMPPTVNITPATPNAANSVLATVTPFPSLWLNEVQADNLNGLTNRAGQRVPWLELYNPSSNTVSLGGLGLANNYTNLLQWVFPTNASLGAGQFKVVFADGLTNLSTTNEWHAGFTLSSGTGSLALSRVDGSDQVQVLDYLNYQNIRLNDSFGSFPDGQSFDRQEFYLATPGAANNGTATPPPSFVAYTLPGAVYTQDFDSLPNPGAASVNAANPVTLNGIVYSLGNPYDFAGPVSTSGSGGLGLSALAGWYGTSVSAAQFGATSGDQTTGGDVSFGLPGNANRALGLLATSSTKGTAFGLRLVNGTIATLTRINVQCTGEVWRQSNLPKTLQCYYYVDLTGTGSFPGSPTGWLPALNVNLPTVAGAVGGTAVDGTLALNQTNLSLLNQAIADWPPGAALWLVWQMTDATGKAQGLAIDNLSFSAGVTPVSVPLSLVTTATGASVALGWPSMAGQNYQLEYKDDLTAPAWTPLGNPVLGTGAAMTLTNDSGMMAQRFFRLRCVNN